MSKVNGNPNLTNKTILNNFWKLKKIISDLGGETNRLIFLRKKNRSVNLVNQ